MAMTVSSPSSAAAGGMQGEETSLLPGLPDDVALRCLAFVPRSQHAHLRCVCTRWRTLLNKGLSSFHALRSSMGLTQNYLLLIPNQDFKPRSLSFYEIHPHNTPTIRKGSLRTPLLADEQGFLRGHACISMGPFVLILGGSRMGPQPSGQLHIFDSTSVTWWRGASMQFPRSYFAYGVIENRLYVAGGFAGYDVWARHLHQAEVYDFDADVWSRVSDMPMNIVIDLSFVYKGALYVRGSLADCRDRVLKLFSYRPSLNEWEEEEWMLDDLLNNVEPLTTNKVTTLQNNEDDTLYMLDVQRAEGFCDYRCYDAGAHLKVLKCVPHVSKWEVVFDVLHEVNIHSDWCCPKRLIYRESSFLSIGKQVVVMDHSEDGDLGDDVNVQVTELGEVIKVSLMCPSCWDVAVIHT